MNPLDDLRNVSIARRPAKPSPEASVLKGIFVIWAVGAVLGLAATVTVAVIILHFVAKFW